MAQNNPRNGLFGFTLRAISSVMVCGMLLAACGSAPSAQPTATLVVIPSETSTPTVTSSATPARPTQTDMPEPDVTPTATPFPAVTPEAGPEAYRLRPWDQSTALRILDEASNTPIAQEYEDMREFYAISLLYEMGVQFPEWKNSTAYLRKMSEAKGYSRNSQTYALLHDLSTETFVRFLENALNNGAFKLKNIESWMENQFGYSSVDSQTLQPGRLFEDADAALIARVNMSSNWGFFIIRADTSGNFTVLSLYPEWQTYAWNDETYQITDLNANGRKEIAVTREHWGIGMTHFCAESLRLYEWDGEKFRDLISGSFENFVNTDYGDCLDFTFLPDVNDRKMIQAGIELYTLCSEVPYREIITFRWDGRYFVEQPKNIPQPQSASSSRCTIDWAVKARADNDTAFNLLRAALANWPVEAEQVWGPAARDYFRLKLATWEMMRGQLEAGLVTLEQLRIRPFTPAYPMPSQVAAAFLDTYALDGLSAAINAVDALYSPEIEAICGHCMYGIPVEEAILAWGFAEPEWSISYSFAGPNDDFLSIDVLPTIVKHLSPTTLEDLQTVVKRNVSKVYWEAEVDLDGLGDEDWLVELADQDEPAKLYAFTRQGAQYMPVLVINTYWRPDPQDKVTRRVDTIPAFGNGTAVVVYQSGNFLFAFRVLAKNEEIIVKMELNLKDESYFDSTPYFEIRDWKVEKRDLIVNYVGQQTVYHFDAGTNKLTPTGFAAELQEKNIAKVERMIYVDGKYDQALELIDNILQTGVWENYNWYWGVNITNPARLKPYLLYLQGLALEMGGDEQRAVEAYWQLWHDYPTSPFSLAAQSKLVRR